MGLDEFVRRLRDGFDLSIPAGTGTHDDLYDCPDFGSLEAFEVLLATEALAGADTPAVEAPPIRTLADAYGYYEALRGATPAP